MWPFTKKQENKSPKRNILMLRGNHEKWIPVGYLVCRRSTHHCFGFHESNGVAFKLESTLVYQKDGARLICYAMAQFSRMPMRVELECGVALEFNGRFLRFNPLAEQSLEGEGYWESWIGIDAIGSSISAMNVE